MTAYMRKMHESKLMEMDNALKPDARHDVLALTRTLNKAEKMVMTMSSVPCQTRWAFFSKVKGFSLDFARKIKSAFEGVDAVHDEAKTIMRESDELQNIWGR